jgi:hypothetical protein
MTPTLPDSPLRRRNEQIIGVLLAVLGLVVLIVAVIALHHPKGHEATSAPTTPAAASSPASSPAASSKSSSATTSKPATGSASTSATGTVTRSAVVPPVTSSSASSASSSGVARLPLVVLNNTDQTGLADTAKARFVAGGWTVTSTGNLVNSIISTCAYYDPDVTGAKAAAQALQAQFPAIKRTAVKFAELPAGPVVVVLTPDYS